MFAEDAGYGPPERIGSNGPVVAGAIGADDVPTTVITPVLPMLTRSPVPTRAMSGEKLFVHASPSVVRFEVPHGTGGGNTGTGFFVGPNGLLVTNYHVIEKMASVDSVKIEM
jgi:S1-C subfamily serine protease